MAAQPASSILSDIRRTNLTACSKAFDSSRLRGLTTYSKRLPLGVARVEATTLASLQGHAHHLLGRTEIALRFSGGKITPEAWEDAGVKILDKLKEENRTAAVEQLEENARLITSVIGSVVELDGKYFAPQTTAYIALQQGKDASYLADAEWKPVHAHARTYFVSTNDDMGLIAKQPLTDLDRELLKLAKEDMGADDYATWADRFAKGELSVGQKTRLARRVELLMRPNAGAVTLTNKDTRYAALSHRPSLVIKTAVSGNNL